MRRRSKQRPAISRTPLKSVLLAGLLRARDLSQSDKLPFTQEFLAEMLGVRRTSVSTVAHTLQQVGFLKYARGRIHIVNLEGLQESACECYYTVCRHYDTLLGIGNNK